MGNKEKWWKSKDPQLQMEVKPLGWILGVLELIGAICAGITVLSLILMRGNVLVWLILTALTFTVVYAYKAIVGYIIEKAGNSK